MPDQSNELPNETQKTLKPDIFTQPTIISIKNPVQKGIYVNVELYNLVIARVGSKKGFSLAVNQALMEWMEKDGTWS